MESRNDRHVALTAGTLTPGAEGGRGVVGVGRDAPPEAFLAGLTGE